MLNVIVKYGNRVIKTLAASTAVKPLIAWGRTKTAALAKGAGATALIVLAERVITALFGDKEVTDRFRRSLSERASDRTWSDNNDTFLRQAIDYANSSTEAAAIVMQALADAGVTIEMPSEIMALFAETNPGAAVDAALASLISDAAVQSLVGDRNPGTATATPMNEGLMEKLQTYEQLRSIMSPRQMQLVQRMVLTFEQGDWANLERLRG